MKRRSDWAEVELDGAEAYRVPREEIQRLGLVVGDRVSDKGLAALGEAAERAEAMRIALRYLSVRPRSRHELSLQLLGKRFGTGIREHVLSRCDAMGVLDDRAFAAALARDRIRLRPCGVRFLERELGSRGVSPEDAHAGIREALEDEGVSESELLDRAARKRAATLQGLASEVAARRLYAFLTRRGFAAHAARSWIEGAIDDIGRAGSKE